MVKKKLNGTIIVNLHLDTIAYGFISNDMVHDCITFVLRKIDFLN